MDNTSKHCNVADPCCHSFQLEFRADIVANMLAAGGILLTILAYLASDALPLYLIAFSLFTACFGFRALIFYIHGQTKYLALCGGLSAVTLALSALSLAALCL